MSWQSSQTLDIKMKLNSAVPSDHREMQTKALEKEHHVLWILFFFKLFEQFKDVDHRDLGLFCCFQHS